MQIIEFHFLGLRKLRLFDRSISDEFSAMQPSSINLFIGPNGGGKSTAIDLIRSIADGILLSTLPRENMQASSPSFFHVFFGNGEHLEASFNCTDIDKFGALVSVKKQGLEVARFDGEVEKFTNSKLEGINEVLSHLSAKVFYRNCHDHSDVPLEDFIKVLNSNARYLNGLSSYPLREKQSAYKSPYGTIPYFLDNAITTRDNKYADISFNDDQSQTNHIPLSLIPSGWKSFGGLIAWLEGRESGSICVIEEPETHLHPRLQRIMMKLIGKIVAKNSLQVFIATHSSVFLDLKQWENDSVKVFEANGHQLRELDDSFAILSELGVRASDICQTNGIVWIEGPSDRIYILNWLEHYCRTNDIPMPIENDEFSFVFYGGALLKHFSTIDQDKLISMFGINRNCVVVMDRDLDFLKEKKNVINAKERIKSNIDKDSSKYCWVTQGYTIENYLPESFFNNYFEIIDQRVRNKSSLSKVDIAYKFCEKKEFFGKSTRVDSDLFMHIKEIYNRIRRWNS